MHIRPILKWPGGKAWIAADLSRVLNAELKEIYFEPFVGGAAVCLTLQPAQGLLSDSNEELIHFYHTLVESPDQVIGSARRFQNTPVDYYRARESNPVTDTGKAGRFLYLNKTCWGGIYRLNRRGQFNVPYGDGRRVICRRQEVLAAASALSKYEFLACDFAESFSRASTGDVIFADPPYTSKGQFNGFVRYNESLFSWEDQVRLATTAKQARRRGAFVAVCGSYHRDLVSLYHGWWLTVLSRTSRVSAAPQARRKVFECVLFSRFPTSRVLSVKRVDDDLLRSIPHYGE